MTFGTTITPAYGILTITNGSVISQTIPQGFTVDGVKTDSSVFVPAGSASGYGVATVSAHAMVSGKSGNIPALAINHVEGSSIYIRNLQPFTGGKDAFTVSYATQQDRLTALDTARIRLKAQIIAGILLKPCDEVVNFQTSVVKLVVKCQFLTFKPLNISNVRITGIRVQGKNLLVDVVFVERPKPIWVK